MTELLITLFAWICYSTGLVICGYWIGVKKANNEIELTATECYHRGYGDAERDHKASLKMSWNKTV